MNNRGTQEIKTERLILRKFLQSDVHNMYNNWASEECVAIGAGFPVHTDESVTQEVVEIWVEEYKKEHIYNWTIELKSINQVIGSITVVKKDLKNEIVEIGYSIGTKWWNNGYATEALNAVIKYLFKEVEVYCIEAACRESNLASIKVLNKCNMKKEAILKNRRLYKGKRENLIIYSILIEDYEIK